MTSTRSNCQIVVMHAKELHRLCLGPPVRERYLVVRQHLHLASLAHWSALSAPAALRSKWFSKLCRVYDRPI